MAKQSFALKYLDQPVADRVSHQDFLDRPFSAFLRQGVHLSDAFETCKRRFSRKKDGEYTKDSQHSLHELASPLLASLMSNLELLERSVYGKLFDLTLYIPDFNTQSLVKYLKDNGGDRMLSHVTGYRGISAAAGNIVSDLIGGWHIPSKVNQHFVGLLHLKSFYSSEVAEELNILWQLRHSIVHTGGTLTIPDSQKFSSLEKYGDNAVVFRPQFIEATVSRFHKILKQIHDDFYPQVQKKFKTGYQGEVARQLDDLFHLDSPRPCYF